MRAPALFSRPHLKPLSDIDMDMGMDVDQDILAFNALLHATRCFIRLMHSLDRSIEAVLVMRQPLNLGAVSYV